MEAASISSIGLSGPGAEQAQGSSGKSRGDKQIPPSSGEPSPTADGGARRSGVKKHHHKHNLKHRYELLETLGRGTYGKVKKAIEIHTGRKVAIKSVRKEKIKDEQDMAHIRREIEIMSSLRHPHIISVYEVFENKDKIVIVMEYASKGELYDFISERHRLSERETRRFFRQIVSAVHYCHKNGVVHRDLKLENVLLDENCNIKIADFGLSNLYHKDRLLQTFCGSPLYASPEIVNGRPYRGPEVDSWALGVLLYTLVYGTMPFDGGDHRNLIRQISNGEYREPTQSSDARGLIRWMLMVNPERRATVEDIASHWWVNWGCKSSVCDCEPRRDAGGAPTLAPFIRRPGRGEPHPAPPETGPFPDQRPKKAKKEEAAAACGGAEEKAGLKRPKSILKTRSSHSQVAPDPAAAAPHAQEGGSASSPEREEEEPALAGGSPPKMAPSLPKKGILKSSRQRESGYYSSPERSESSEQLGGAVLLARAGSPPKRAAGRKSILKRDGKYSARGGPPAGEPAPGDSGLSRSQSRPSSMVGDAPGLSAAALGGAEWPPTAAASAAARPNIRPCVSAENLLQLAGFRGPLGAGRGGRGRRGSPGDDGSFSLLEDLDDVTQVYQQALDISGSLS
ncbi:NUAK family SNF1-like kinase 1 [Anguilla anguilla]|uniref:NUAK family SNF1-like kinase 1 n=1 Tax=Anguilla anguilla TaxID=7936 RepID=UPI0015B32F60|nr:NUAK family SNF1-like kinase 1 [Anguilla anguilla]